jgi:hypothetical protein
MNFFFFFWKNKLWNGRSQIYFKALFSHIINSVSVQGLLGTTIEFELLRNTAVAA